MDRKNLGISSLLLIWFTASWITYGTEKESNEKNDLVFNLFPLMPRLHFTYEYRNTWGSSDEIYTYMGIDSGLVAYIVLDSIVKNDTTVAWSVVEIQTIWHWRSTSLSTDTTYWTYDTLSITLNENTSGRHEVSCSGIIWKFPLYQPFQQIYRFGDSTNVAIIREWSDILPYHHIYDTLLFSEISGLYERHTTFQENGPITYGSSRIDCKQKGTPILVVEDEVAQPKSTNLDQNYPNPFNPNTTIRYQLPMQSYVTLKVFDVLGREVATLINSVEQPGYKSVTFSARGVSTSGGDASELTSGVYFYRLQAGNFVETKKFVLLR